LPLLKFQPSYINLYSDVQTTVFSRGDQSVPEGERTRGVESDDAAASTQAVSGLHGDCESTAHSRASRRAAATSQCIKLSGPCSTVPQSVLDVTPFGSCLWGCLLEVMTLTEHLAVSVLTS